MQSNFTKKKAKKKKSKKLTKAKWETIKTEIKEDSNKLKCV